MGCCYDVPHYKGSPGSGLHSDLASIYSYGIVVFNMLGIVCLRFLASKLGRGKDILVVVS